MSFHPAFPFLVQLYGGCRGSRVNTWCVRTDTILATCGDGHCNHGHVPVLQVSAMVFPEDALCMIVLLSARSQGLRSRLEMRSAKAFIRTAFLIAREGLGNAESAAMWRRN
jgi:hypothetical protein